MFRCNKTLSVAMLGVIGLFATAGFAVAQPAPGLTEMRVIGVASPQFAGGQAWDTNIPAGTYTTTNNHGGAWVRVAVFERGYATSQTAFFGGVRMQLYQSDPLYGADRKAYGWIRYYYLATNFSSGRFTTSATSIAMPWGTKSTWIYVN